MRTGRRDTEQEKKSPDGNFSSKPSIPLASIERIMRKSTKKQISRTAVIEMAILVEDLISEITELASERENQRRVMKYDIKPAFKKWQRKELISVLSILLNELERLLGRIETLLLSLNSEVENGSDKS